MQLKGYSQLISFNKTYGHYELLDGAASGCEIKGQGYVIDQGVTLQTTDSGYINLLFTDYNGDSIYSKIFAESNLALISYKIKQLKNNNLALICFKRIANQNDLTGYLYKLNMLGDTLFTKQLPTNYTRTLLNDFCETHEGGFIITGYAQNHVGNTLQQSQLYIVKTDSLGNKLWDTLVGNNVDWEFGRGIVELADSSFVVAGYRYKAGNGTYEGISLKFDKNNKLIWNKKYNNGNSSFSGLLKLKSENIIFYGGKLISVGPPADGDILMTKIDTGGNIIWSKTYGIGTLPDAAFCGVTTNLANDEYILAGANNNLGQNKQVGWFARFDSAGTAIHERGWAAVPMYHDVSNFNSVIQASDGGTVLFGWASVYDTAFGGYSQDAWIVKLDSNGCDIDTCPNIVSSASIPQIGVNDGNYIRCVPNPTSGVFAISPSIKIEQVQIFNAMGAEVSFVKRDNEIDISALATGLYYLRCSNGKKVYVAKVMKE